MPPEKIAYALARYSRSPDSVRDSIEWVRTHDSAKFLESFYFQYGHASIADLGHLVVCFEGISELAATDAEDEQLWDGQARSSRYQDFSRAGFVIPREFGFTEAAIYEAAGRKLIATYHDIQWRLYAHLKNKIPRPADMKPETYERILLARAFDVSRYVLFFGIPTGVGQVTSIRTLERQIRRLKVSEYEELRSLAEEIASKCTLPPSCAWNGGSQEPIAPTLAKYVDPDRHLAEAHNDLKQWVRQNLQPSEALSASRVESNVDLLKPSNTPAEITATLLYSASDLPFRYLYEMACGWNSARRNEVIDLALRSRTRRDELLRAFRGGLYAFDIVMDIGAYRDLHRHRRCQQYRQAYSGRLGFDTPQALYDAGAADVYQTMMHAALKTMAALPPPGSHYLLPFGARSRFLFKMDFAEAEYMIRLRTGVKGHFSYRNVAWKMKQKLEELEPELGRLIQATPPWMEDPLTR